MKKINITITGALGRMGKILVKKIISNKKLKLQSVTDIKIKKIFKNIKTQKNSIDAFKKTDIIIDFSRPNACLEILNFAKKLKKKLSLEQQVFLRSKIISLKIIQKKLLFLNQEI
jgi:4-hydroxy-tetrahydrodipicolinate reductase